MKTRAALRARSNSRRPCSVHKSSVCGQLRLARRDATQRHSVSRLSPLSVRRRTRANVHHPADAGIGHVTDPTQRQRLPIKGVRRGTARRQKFCCATPGGQPVANRCSAAVSAAAAADFIKGRRCIDRSFQSM